MYILVWSHKCYICNKIWSFRDATIVTYHPTCKFLRQWPAPSAPPIRWTLVDHIGSTTKTPTDNYLNRQNHKLNIIFTDIIYIPSFSLFLFLFRQNKTTKRRKVSTVIPWSSRLRTKCNWDTSMTTKWPCTPLTWRWPFRPAISRLASPLNPFDN